MFRAEYTSPPRWFTRTIVRGSAGTLGGPETRAGITVGTVGYMSPEQTLGQPVDIRSELFSLGARCSTKPSPVRRAFTGSTPAAVFDAILHTSPPPLSAMLANADPHLQNVIDKLLERNRELRYQSPADLRADLRRVQRGRFESSIGHATATVEVRAAKRRWLAWSGATIALTALAALVYFWPAPTPVEPPAAPPLFTYSQITTDGTQAIPKLSADGRSVVFASRRAGNWDIVLRRVGGRNDISLRRLGGGRYASLVFSRRRIDRLSLRSSRCRNLRDGLDR